MADASGPGNGSAHAESSRQPAGEETAKGTAAAKETKNKPAPDPVKEQTPSGQVFYGTVIPYKEVNVQGEQSAAIIMMKYKEGDVVKKGEILVKLNDESKKLEPGSQHATEHAAGRISNADGQYRPGE